MAIEIKDGIVTMTADEYEELLDDSVFLNCLRNEGVDNWSGYEFAQERFQEYKDQ